MYIGKYTNTNICKYVHNEPLENGKITEILFALKSHSG